MILARNEVTNNELEKILDYWKTNHFETNEEVLDTVRRYDVNLRVPIIFALWTKAPRISREFLNELL